MGRFSDVLKIDIFESCSWLGLRVGSFKSGQSIVHDPTGVEVESISIDPTPREVACSFEGNSARKFHKICIYLSFFWCEKLLKIFLVFFEQD